MLRLPFYTAIRVSELASIRIEDIDLEGCKIFIDQGKGSKGSVHLISCGFSPGAQTRRIAIFSRLAVMVYQHLSLEQVERAYQAAVRDLNI